MTSGKRLLANVVGALAALSGGVAFANGINPPAIRETAAVTAICTERSSGNRIELFRVTIAGDNSPDTINVRAADIRERLRITQIAKITLTSTNVDGDGFTKAALIRRNSTNTESVSVGIRTGGMDLRLRGWTMTGSRLDITLSMCGTIEFATKPSSGRNTPASPVGIPIVPAS